MRQLFKCFSILIVMIACVLPSEAANYRRDWKSVERFIQEDLPESAYNKVESILAKAERKGDCYQMLKSRVFLITIGAEYREDYVNEAFAGMHSLIPELKDEYLPLGWALLGNCYRDYYMRNRYSACRREHLEEIPDDITLWDDQVFQDTIQACLLKSITLNTDASRNADVNDFAGLIEPGNKTGEWLMPSLFDALLWNAIWNNNTISVSDAQAEIYKDSRLYSLESFLAMAPELEAQGLLDWNLRVMSRITAHQRPDQNTDIYAGIEYEFLNLLRSQRWVDQTLLNNSLLERGLYYLPLSEISARFIASYAEQIGLDESEAGVAAVVELCRKAEQAWPDSYGATRCHNWVLDKSAPHISLSGTSELSASNPVFINVSHRNTSRIWLKAVRGNPITDIYGRDVVTRLLGQPAEASWSVELDNPSGFTSRNTLIALPELTPGNHYILASSTPDFGNEDMVSFMQTDVCSFVYAKLGIDRSAELPGYVVDRLTGKPVRDCSYRLFQIEGYGVNRKETLITEGVTGADGLVDPKIPHVSFASMNWALQLEKGEDRATVSFYRNVRQDRPEFVMPRIYTDRYTYRPGETVQFNCIVYQTDGYSLGHTVNNCDILFELHDANWQVVDTLRLATDKFGTAAGSLTIPRNLLPGRFTINAQVEDENAYGSSRPINVEEFRQPTFQIEMEGIAGNLVTDDTAVVRGTATTYTGVPVGGAKVSYKVSYEAFHRLMWNHDINQIASGETLTASDGTFSIKFLADAGKALGYEPESLNFSVEAQVTDLNGETHGAMTYIHTGRDVQYVRLTGASVFTSAPELRLHVWNGAQNYIAGKVNVTFERLVPPESPKLGILNSFASMGSFFESIHVAPELRERFPVYDFDKSGKEEWTVCGEAYSQTIDVPAGNAYKLVLPEALPTGTYRVRADIDGVTGSADTLLITSVIQKEQCMPDNDLLLATPLNDSYKVGQTAQILVGSAFPEAVIYYVVENRFGLVDKGIILPQGKVTTLSVPVTKEMKGGFTVRFGTVYQKLSDCASVNIDVPFYDKELDISLVTFRDMLEPDKTETWELCVRDSEGKPVDASLMLAMYDSAMDIYGDNYWQFMPWSKAFFSASPMFNMSQLWSTSLTPEIKYQGYELTSLPVFAKVVSPLSHYPSYALTVSKGLPRVGAMTLRGASNVVEMEEFEGLGITTIDEALQGRIAGLDIVETNDAGMTLSEPALTVDEDVAMENVIMRTDMNPTAFFISNMRTDRNGKVSFSFTTPQLLTRWNFQGLAHTTDLKSAFFIRQVTTRKQLMIQPRAPRFVRQGDTFIFSSKLMNVTEQEMTATVRLEILDPISSKALNIIDGDAVQKVTVQAGQSSEVSFRINVPKDINMLEYRITAASAKHSDGQQELVPVLSSRTVVTESVSLFNNGNETRSFELKALSGNQLSETATDRTLTLEYTPSPIWYAIQALPYLEQYDNPSNECLFHRYFANALSSHIIATRPAVGRMLRKWADIPADSWQTQLEKNQDLRQTLLQETPWVLNSKSEKENLRRLAEAFTMDKIEAGLQESLKELLKRQEPDGGWSWFPGFAPDIWVTRTIVSGIGQLQDAGCLDIESDPELRSAVSSALHWLDYETRDYYDKYDRKDMRYVCENDLEWLLTHAHLKSLGVAQGCEDIYNFLLRLAETQATHDLSLYTRASLAQLMSLNGNSRRAEELVATLVERSLYDEEQGRWWRDNTGGYLWHQAPVETQSRIIQALLSVRNRKTEAAECARWLLKQRQTTHWATSPSTAQAVIALLSVGDTQGMSLDVPAVSYIYIGGETIQAGGDDADAGYIIRKWQEPADPAMGKVSVRNDSKEIGWGALSIQYTEEMDKVHYSENGISLKRTLYRVDEKSDGTTLHEVAGDESLRVGDRLRIRIELSCDRNLEYVQLKDMRAASFEPVSTHAGLSYNLHDDLRSYVVPENASQVFYIDRLSRGSYLIEYDVYAEQAGTFSSGVVSAQCMYAPEFRSTASSASVTVE